MLAAGFEATAALHFGVERIGRYLQARYERRPLWETTVMHLAGQTRGAGSDALFSPIYLLACLANFVPVALTALMPELVALGAVHAIFVWRVFALRRTSAAQRQAELKVFREILEGGAGARTKSRNNDNSARASFLRQRDREQQSALGALFRGRRIERLPE